MYKSQKNRFIPLIVGGMCCMQGSYVSAADAPVLEEIIVSAQRREQSLQDIPISTSVVSGELIEKANIESIGDLFRNAPNVSFTEAGSRSRVEISMRGIANLPRDLTLRRQSFAFYVDEFNTVAATFNPQMKDVERVEILRGPQGTFYGRNAVGGAINVTMNKPSVEAVTGELSFGYDNFDTAEVTGIVNLPVSDTLAVRFMGNYAESDGIIDNKFPGSGADSSGYEYESYRAALRWTPTEKLTVDLSASYSDEFEDFRAGVATGVLSPFGQNILAPFWGVGAVFGAPVTLPSLPVLAADGGIRTAARSPFAQSLVGSTLFGGLDAGGVGFYPNNTDEAFLDDPQGFDTDYSIFTARIQYDFDRVTFTSITGAIERNTLAELGDIDHTGFDYFREFTDEERESFSQEFRLSSHGDWKVDWVVGALYAKDEGESAQDTFIGDDAADDFFVPGGTFLEFLDGSGEVESWAVFADATWHVSDRLDLTAGIRYSQDDITESLLQQTNDLAGNTLVNDSTLSEEFSEVTPRVAVNYSLSEDVSLYAIASKGYRPGGVQTNFAIVNQTFDEETVWNYEIGSKGSLFDGRVNYSLAAFRMEYENMQVEDRVDAQGAGGAIVFAIGTNNIEDAVSQGIEFELTAAVTENLIVHAGVGYTDTEFKSQDVVIESIPMNIGGKDLPGAPEWTSNISAEYFMPSVVAGYDGFVRIEGYYRSETTPRYRDIPFDMFPHRSPSFDVWNLRAGLESERIAITGYVENLFDEDYFTTAYQKGFISGTHVTPNPLTFGVSFKVKWN